MVIGHTRTSEPRPQLLSRPNYQSFSLILRWFFCTWGNHCSRLIEKRTNKYNSELAQTQCKLAMSGINNLQEQFVKQNSNKTPKVCSERDNFNKDVRNDDIEEICTNASLSNLIWGIWFYLITKISQYASLFSFWFSCSKTLLSGFKTYFLKRLYLIPFAVTNISYKHIL